MNTDADEFLPAPGAEPAVHPSYDDLLQYLRELNAKTPCWVCKSKNWFLLASDDEDAFGAFMSASSKSLSDESQVYTLTLAMSVCQTCGTVWTLAATYLLNHLIPKWKAAAAKKEGKAL